MDILLVQILLDEQIPVTIHNVPEEKVFRPKTWDHFIKNVEVKVNLC